MANDAAAEIPPPKLEMLMLAKPTVTRSAGVMAPIIWLALTNVVARALPFHNTVEPETKFEPFTIRFSPAAPAKV